MPTRKSFLHEAVWLYGLVLVENGSGWLDCALGQTKRVCGTGERAIEESRSLWLGSGHGLRQPLWPTSAPSLAVP